MKKFCFRKLISFSAIFNRIYFYLKKLLADTEMPYQIVFRSYLHFEILFALLSE